MNAGYRTPSPVGYQATLWPRCGFLDADHPYKGYRQDPGVLAPTSTIQRPHKTIRPLKKRAMGSRAFGTMVKRKIPVETVPSPMRTTPARADTRVYRIPAEIRTIPTRIRGLGGKAEGNMARNFAAVYL